MAYEKRFMDIYIGLLFTDIIDKWRDALAANTSAQWFAIVSEHTLPEVKALLDREEPPRLSDLQRFPWIDTNDFGTYGQL